MANQQEQTRREDKANRTLCSCRAGGKFFKIRVRGHLDGRWTDWLEGLEVELLDYGEMILSGTLVDQAALMGVLNKLNGLNLALLSVSQVNRIEQD